MLRPVRCPGSAALHHSPSPSRAGQWRRVATLGLALAVFSTAAAPAGSTAPRDFDLPTDAAVRTLKLFSAQSGRGLIADAELIREIRTNAVRGHLTAGEVLARMLAGTGLRATEDARNGAFVVHRETPLPNAPRAAPTSSGDRPGSKTNRRSNQRNPSL